MAGDPVSGQPCPCWVTPSLHEGHCCFRTAGHDYSLPLPCGHDDAGKRMRAAAETVAPQSESLF